MAQFYMQNNGSLYFDFKLKSANWEDAITEAKNTQNYAITKLKKSIKDKRGIDDYVEVYCGKLRRELTFADLHDENVYRRIY